jgi:hypothetical protein
MSKVLRLQIAYSFSGYNLFFLNIKSKGGGNKETFQSGMVESGIQQTWNKGNTGGESSWTGRNNAIGPVI